MNVRSLIAVGFIVFSASVAALACPSQPPMKVDMDSIGTATVDEGETLTFDGTGIYYCPDSGDIVQYQWILPPEAYQVQGDHTSTLTCKFSPAGGPYEVELQVRCEHDLWNTDYVNYPTENRYVVQVTVKNYSSPWYVSVDGDDTNNGQSWTYPFRTIQTAIDSASDGDEIFVASGDENAPAVYYEQLDMKGKSLNIHSEDPDGPLEEWELTENTILDAQKQGTAVVFRGSETEPGSGESNFEGITITGGYPAGDGLALHLKFDETAGTATVDSSGKGRDGTLVSAPNWTSNGHEGGALEFDGVDDYVEIQNYHGVTRGVSRTVSGWIKTQGTSTSVVCSWGMEEGGQKWMFLIFNTGEIGVGVWGGYIKGSNPVNDGNWHHIAAVLEDDGSADLSEIKLYVDGVLETNTTIGGVTGARPIITSGSEKVVIGARTDSNTSGYLYHYAGLMDDICIYSRALNEQEIQDTVGSPVPIVHLPFDIDPDDTSGNSYDGTEHGDPVYTEGAIQLDGDGDYVELPTNIINPTEDSFSAFAWVRLDGKNASSLQVILQQCDDGTDPGRCLLWRGTDDTLCTSLGTGAPQTISSEPVFSVTGQWHHVGLTYNGVTVTIYADGKACGSANRTVESCNGGLLIGRQKTNLETYWNGLIDDLQIFKRVLSSDEIAKLAGQTFYLEGHWKLDGDVIDSSVNQNDGVLSGTPQFVNGFYGQALVLNGVDNYVDCGDLNLIGRSCFTISAWINPYEVNNYDTVIGNSQGGSLATVRFNMDIYDNKLRVVWGDGVGFDSFYSAADTFLSSNIGQWRHVAFVSDGVTAKLYIDGQQSGAGTITRDLAASNEDWTIGRGFNSSSYLFNGEIDDVRVYSRALTNTEIQELADKKPRLVTQWKMDGDCNDSTGSHDGTVQSSPVYTEGMVGDAISLNGTDQYISVPDDPQLKPQFPLALSAWINVATSGTNGFIITTDYSTNIYKYSGVSLRLAADGSDKIVISYGDGTSASPTGRGTKVGTTVLQSGRWYHVIGVIRDPQDMSIYINGVDDGGEYTGTSTRPIYYEGHESLIGGNKDQTILFDGMIDDVRIYNYGLTAAEAKSLYQSRFSDGGGIKGHGASATISKCIVGGNVSETDGGGIADVDGAIVNCFFMNNYSDGNGGGFSCCNGDIINCLIAGNAVNLEGGKGGAVYIDTDSSSFVNCTISNNVAFRAGGVFNQDGIIDIQNSIFWDNRDFDEVTETLDEQILGDGEEVTVVDYSCIQGGWPSGLGNIDEYPKFINPGHCEPSVYPDSITLQATVRDFIVNGESTLSEFSNYLPHPDFECNYDTVELGIVGALGSLLGQDDKPVFSEGRFTSVNSKESFNEWFNDIEEKNLKTQVTLELEHQGGGVYKFSDTEYFPIDDYLFGSNHNGHNYHFTLELHTEFYYDGRTEFFEIAAADDDLFVYINRKLVVDIGGIHEATSRYLEIVDGVARFYADSNKENLIGDPVDLEIQSGSIVSFDLFFAERHTISSHLQFSTTLDLKSNVSTGDYHLLPGSACIDAGDNNAVAEIETDLDCGLRRIDDPDTEPDPADPNGASKPVVDMGAYEYYVNQSPVIDAGSDIVVAVNRPVVLNEATVSDDNLPDPNLLDITWTTIAGPEDARIYSAELPENPTVVFSMPGVYTLELTANDSEYTVSDTMRATAVLLDAGGDQLKYFDGQGTVGVSLDATIDGSDPDAGMVDWEVVYAPAGSNPSLGDITEPNDPDIVVTLDAIGSYVLELSAEFSGEVFEDKVVVSVVADSSGNALPHVTALANPAEVDWPLNMTHLSGSVSDDGFPDGYLWIKWEKFSGPLGGQVTFGNYSYANVDTTATFSKPGVYILKLSASDVFDDDSHTVEQLVCVKLLDGEFETNGSPLVDAGEDIVITHSPINQYEYVLSQVLIDDPTPTDLLNVQWYVINGPAGGMGFDDATAKNPTITFFSEGVYELCVTADDGEFTANDTLTITVLDAEPVIEGITIDAGEDTLLVLPEGEAVTHTLSGWCHSVPAGLFSCTEWQIAVEPNQSDVQFNPALPAVSVLDPNVTFTTPGDYVFKLVAKDGEGTEVASDEVYINVKPASQEFTTYLYLYSPPESSNLVFSSYEDGTKLAYQSVDPNGILGQMYDVNPEVSDANILDVSQATPMQKGQYAYIDGQDGVYKVTSANNKFSVLAGDTKNDPVSGYFVMSENGLGVDTEFYSHITRKAWNGRRLVVFSYQDNTQVTIKWDSGDDGVCGDPEDEYLVMQSYDLQTETCTDVVMNNYVLDKGEHVYRIPDDDIYIHVQADKPVSVEECNDSGFYVPSSEGRWTGQNFNVYVDSITDVNADELIYYTEIVPLSIIAYEDDTDVFIRQNPFEGSESLLWSGVLHEGTCFYLPQRQLISEITDANPVSYDLNFDVLEDDIEQKAYLRVNSTKPISVNIRPRFDGGIHAYGNFVPDRTGTGAGTDLIGDCVPKAVWVDDHELDRYVLQDMQRYFTVLAHNDDTQFSIYDPVTWQPVVLNPDIVDPNVPGQDGTIISLNEGQHFKAQDYLDDADKTWRVVSTRPVGVSSGANMAFAEYAPLTGIQSPTPTIEMAAKIESGYPDTCSDPNVYPWNPEADEITYTITYWNPSSNPNVYGQTIIDELPDQVDPASVRFTGTNGSYDPESNTVVWDIGTLTAGHTAGEPNQVTVTVRVNQYPKNCNKIVNRARIENIHSYTATLPVIIPVDMTGLPAIGDIIYVDGHAAGLNNGSSWRDAFNDLQKALLEAEEITSESNLAGTVDIWVAAGIYSPGPREHSTFQMIDGIDMYGGFVGTETDSVQRDFLDPNNQTILEGYAYNGILDGGIYAERLTYNGSVVTTATAVLDGFTVRGGRECGVYCEDNSPVIQNCIIENNMIIIFRPHSYGWELGSYGIKCYGGNPIISNNIICENGLGGVYLDHTSNARVENNIIMDNGTGIYLCKLHNPATIRNNTIVYNNSHAILHTELDYGPLADISNCIIWGKDDLDFDVMEGYNRYAVDYCCLSDPNTADPNATSHPVFANYYLHYEENNQTSDANMVYVSDGSFYHPGDIIEIADDDILRTVTRVTEGIDYDTVDFVPVCVRDIPQYESISKWGTETTSVIEDYHLKANSPCIDAGDCDYEPADDETDIDGDLRVLNGQVDIGADEYALCWIYAGSDRIIDFGETISITDADFVDEGVSVVNYGTLQPGYTVTWELISKPGSSTLQIGVVSTQIHPAFSSLNVKGQYRFRLTGYKDGLCVGHDDVVIAVSISVDASTGAPYQSRLIYDSASGQIRSEQVNLIGQICGIDLQDIQITWRFSTDAHILTGQMSNTIVGNSIETSVPAWFYETGNYQIILSVYDLAGRFIAESEPVTVSIDTMDFDVDAGPDQWIETNSLRLNGKVFGMDPGQVDVFWIQLSGPGEVAFTPEFFNDPPVSNISNPVVEFPDEGTYRFIFIADHGGDVRMDELEIIVGQPVTVSAGPDRWAVLRNGIATVTTEYAFAYPLEGVTIQWYDEDNTAISGADMAVMDFEFTETGEYVYTLRAAIDDEVYEDTVTITIMGESVLAEPNDIMILTGSYSPVVLPELLSLKYANLIGPESALLSCRWSQTDGPGYVTFYPSADTDQTSAYIRPAVEFSQAGMYDLQLAVYNGNIQSEEYLIDSETVTIEVLPEGTTIQFDQTPPIITAFEAQINGASIWQQEIPKGQVSIAAGAMDSGDGMDELSITLDGNTASPLAVRYGSPVFPSQMNIEYSLNTSSLSLGNHTISLTARDKRGNYLIQTDGFSVGTTTVTEGSPPIAGIANLDPVIMQGGQCDLQNTLPRIEKSLFTLLGAAYDLNTTAVQYKIEIFRPEIEMYAPSCWYLFDGNNFEKPDYLVQNINISEKTRTGEFYLGEVRPGTDPNHPFAEIGTLDLAGLENGVYWMLLTVQKTGDGLCSYATAKFILDTPLKIGNVKFSQEDLSIPVGGVALRVIRTYNSFDKDKDGDFGYGWSYSIANMDIELNEERKVLQPSRTFGTGFPESVRVDSDFNRDVTLTLPDGRRTTFQFYLEYDNGSLYNGELPSYIAKYATPPGVDATLDAYQEGGSGEDSRERLIGIPFTDLIYWNNPVVPITSTVADSGAHDFGRYILTTGDGTKYIFDRRSNYAEGGGNYYEYSNQVYYAEPKGPLYLSTIITANNDIVKFNTDPTTLQVGQENGEGIQHYQAGQLTKAIEITYDEFTDRIIEIYAPSEQGTTIPTVWYEYDPDTGNLTAVHKLVTKRASKGESDYETISYLYDNNIFDPQDHYLTDIQDPRGLTPIRYLYDDSGRLVATVDAKGNEIAILHGSDDFPNENVEVVFDRNNNRTVYFYDEIGNVVKVQDAFNHLTCYEYNDPLNPNRTTRVVHQVPDPSDPSQLLDAVTTMDYENCWDDDTDEFIPSKVAVETVIDPAGNLTRTEYDEQGKVTRVVQGENAADPNAYIELTTSRNYYVSCDAVYNKNLPYLTGVTTTDPGTGDLIWHSISVTYYDTSNRVVASVQVNMDSNEKTALFSGSNIVDYESLPDYNTHWLESPIIIYAYNETASGSSDQPYSVTDASGNTQYFWYDENNVQKAAWSLWDDPNTASTETVRTVNINETDAQGRSVRSIRIVDDADESISSILIDVDGYIDNNPAVFESMVQGRTFYNDIGKVDYVVDQCGSVTKYEYDETGQLVETLVYESFTAFATDYQNYPTDTEGILTISRTLYDAEGRTLVSVGPYAGWHRDHL